MKNYSAGGPLNNEYSLLPKVKNVVGFVPKTINGKRNMQGKVIANRKNELCATISSQSQKTVTRVPLSSEAEIW